MTTDIVFTLEVRIQDPEAFAMAARLRAERDGLSREDIASYTAEDLLGCAVLLFDPGEPPAGCEVTSSSAQELEHQEVH